MLRVGLNEDAGRTAEFGRLVADDPSFDLELRAFYEIGPRAKVSEAQVAAAIAAARRFVASIEALLRDRDGTRIEP